MQRIIWSLLLFAATLTQPTSAQTTWIVDATGGGHFTTLSLALRVAVEGDTVILRSYADQRQDLTIRTGITLRCLTGLSRYHPLRVTVVPAGSPVRITGLTSGAVHVENCAAAVHLNSCTFYSSTITDSGQVTLNACRVTGRLEVTRSTVLATNCEFLGLDGQIDYNQGGTYGGYWYLSQSPTLALSAEASTLRLASCKVWGGHGTVLPQLYQPYLYIAGKPGMILEGGSEVSFTGDSRTSVFGGHTPTASGTPIVNPAIQSESASLVEYDPRTGLNLGSIWGGPTTRAINRGTILVSDAPPGGTMNIEVIAEANTTVLVGVSFAAQPLQLPPLGELWLDPNTAALFGGGVVPAEGKWTSTWSLPAWAPRGTVLCFQAGVLRPSSARLSSPCVAMIL